MKTAPISGSRLNTGGDGQNRTADLWVMNPKNTAFISVD